MPKSQEFIAIAVMLMATIALSIDIMLPALSIMASEFGVADENQRQQVIITLFCGLAFGQLIFGPLSDSIGRRPAITIGAILFVCGGLICATSTTFENLIAGRILQGVGAAVTASVTTLIGIIVAGLVGLSFKMSLYPNALGYTVSAALALALMSTSSARSR